MKKLISYANYQFWVFAVGGGLLALAYGRLWEKHEASVSPYEVALEVDPDYALGHYNVGVVKEMAGQVEPALAHYAAAMAADPHDHTPCFNRARLSFRLEKLDDALTFARCAVDHDADGASYDLLGQVHVARGEFASAIPALEEAIRLRPGHAATGIELGIAYASLSKLPEAQVALETAIALRPDLAEAWSNLGLVTLNRGDTARAYKSFLTAIAMDPKQTRALKYLAILDGRAGRLAAAQRWVARWLAIAPGDAEAQALRTQLGTL